MASGNNDYWSTNGDGQREFASELRAAIKESGLSLDRIQVRLQQRGVPVSVTALSYWQSGKRQPERDRSIAAVHALEEILGRPRGALVSLLKPPRPRGQSGRFGSPDGPGIPAPRKL